MATKPTKRTLPVTPVGSRTLLAGMSALLLVAIFGSIPGVRALGGELASLSNPPLTSLGNHVHRQNVCHRSEEFRAGKRKLRDGLSGLKLQPLMPLDYWLDYHPETGLHPDHPGLLAEIMDALAESANFTWRNSFGVMEPPEVLNRTWTEVLFWGVENYDISVHGWDLTVERMEKGISFFEPWYDGSTILIHQQDPPVDVNTIAWFNWTFPFEPAVWALIIFTILLSGLVHQFIEYMHNEQDDRPLFQWFSDNMYLSFLNFTQNFEYAPDSTAGRILAVSMAMWALVMTATYTANLASLFVQEQRQPLVVGSIDQAIAMDIPICTWAFTNSDNMIQQRFEAAKRVPKLTELEGFQALRRGECGLVAAYKDSWLGYEGRKEYNPDCDLEWVGRVVDPIKSGMAVKTDSGDLCTSFIRDVLTVHMAELIMDGGVQKLFSKYRDMEKDQNCDSGLEADDLSRRRLAWPASAIRTAKTTDAPDNSNQRRKLSAAAAANGGGTDDAALNVQQLLGTFAFHWVGMAIATLICIGTTYYEKRGRHKTRFDESSRIFVRNRFHGPVIGRNQKQNTTALVRNDYKSSLLLQVERHLQVEKSMRHLSSTQMNKLEEDSSEDIPCFSSPREFGSHDNCASATTDSPHNGNFVELERKQQDLSTKVEGLSTKVEDLSSQMHIILTVLQKIHEEQLRVTEQKRQEASEYTA